MNWIWDTSAGSAFAAGVASAVAGIVPGLVRGIIVVTGTDAGTVVISDVGIMGGVVVIPGPDGFGGVWVQPLRKTRPAIRHTNNNIFRTMVRFNYPSFSLTLLFIFFALEKRIWTLPVHSGTMKIGEILRIDMRAPRFRAPRGAWRGKYDFQEIR